MICEYWGTGLSEGNLRTSKADIKIQYDPENDVVLSFYAGSSELYPPGERPIDSISEGWAVPGFLEYKDAREALLEDICSEMTVDPWAMRGAITDVAEKCRMAL